MSFIMNSLTHTNVNYDRYNNVQSIAFIPSTGLKLQSWEQTL